MGAFGLVLPIQGPGTDLHTLLAELGEEVLAAERAGFDAVFLPEFHQAHGGALVSPLLLLAWLGARTSRIRLGTLVLSGPLHDPVRLAEDAAMLDQATGGRVILGLGVAHVEPDFKLYGVERRHRGAILDELLDLLDLAWADAAFDHRGRFFQRAGHVTAPPFAGRPPVWIAAHGPRGLARAGARGNAWVCDPQRDVTTAARLAETYRAAADAAGRPSEVVLFRDGWVGESREDCERRWAPHAMKVHRLYYNLGTYLPEFEPWVDEVRAREDFTLERLAPGRLLYGSPAEVRGTADAWFAQTGASMIAVRMRQPTGPSHAEALEAIERLGREVIGHTRT
ncbi:MAG TPA: LLM class flavin-dependent oxidoreductase [Baekduia sp.]|uniref:LLM class flavin-dependent oxidoreductase n=1 Tax=Baekduia sp. TaxID=2600305 RepID=UPI002D79ACE0|nr:LLM class flavin-dependent oxidoreductase [Baekduia sp.]HET6507015.1 LLM class flavin-dependent oxidoreductase [Baekduia sp.]